MFSKENNFLTKIISLNKIFLFLRTFQVSTNHELSLNKIFLFLRTFQVRTNHSYKTHTLIMAGNKIQQIQCKCSKI